MPHSSSYIGVSNVVTYGYNRTQAAKDAEYEVRSILEQIRDHTSIITVSNCFPYLSWYRWPELAVQRFATGQYRIGRCKNKNACPVCARANEARQRSKFHQDYDALIDSGYVPYWQTFEAGFIDGTTGKQRYKAMADLWRALKQNKAFRRLCARLGALEFRVTEFTYIGRRWTPHYHVVWMFSPDAQEKEIAQFLDEVSCIWRGKQKNHPRCTDNSRALYSAALDDGDSARKARYVFKTFYLELENKEAKLPENLEKPFDYLVYFCLTGDLDALHVWTEYEAVSLNTRRYVFSRNWDIKADFARKATVSN